MHDRVGVRSDAELRHRVARAGAHRHVGGADVDGVEGDRKQFQVRLGHGRAVVGRPARRVVTRDEHCVFGVGWAAAEDALADFEVFLGQVRIVRPAEAEVADEKCRQRHVLNNSNLVLVYCVCRTVSVFSTLNQEFWKSEDAT